MSDTKAQPEPTMEEILASIRRIISENDEQTTARPGAPAAAAGDDVLDLTDMVADDGSVVSLSAPFDDAPTEDNLIDDGGEDGKAVADDEDDGIPPVPDDGVAGQDEAEEEPEEPEVTMADAQDDKVEFSSDELIGKPTTEGLMAAASAAATTAAFASLSRASQQTTGGGMSLGSGRTLEDLVQEMIRPMIKEWLDANLPAMTERLVRRELARLARRAEE